MKKLYFEICKTLGEKYVLLNTESTSCKIKIDRREKKLTSEKNLVEFVRSPAQGTGPATLISRHGAVSHYSAILLLRFRFPWRSTIQLLMKVRNAIKIKTIYLNVLFMQFSSRK